MASSMEELQGKCNLVIGFVFIHLTKIPFCCLGHFQNYTYIQFCTDMDMGNLILFDMIWLYDKYRKTRVQTQQGCGDKKMQNIFYTCFLNIYFYFLTTKPFNFLKYSQSPLFLQKKTAKQPQQDQCCIQSRKFLGMSIGNGPYWGHIHIPYSISEIF